MQSLEQIGVRVGVGTLFGRLPELLLRRVPIHRAYFDEAICGRVDVDVGIVTRQESRQAKMRVLTSELFGRISQIAGIGTDDGPVIDQAVMKIHMCPHVIRCVRCAH